MRSLKVLIVFLTLTLTVRAQLKPVGVVSKGSHEIIIPYKKYILPNGLTVVIHEDHSDPIVQVDVTYHVGSAREELGKSGFAHFFEHMMFQGSDNVGDEQHFKYVTEAGGVLNGSTNRDRTNYFETVPSNQLERMLWLEADRMGFFLDAVTQKKFEIQRATVKNERGQNYDNKPYGLVGQTTARNLYPYGHPYSWLTIGYLEELDKVTLDDLKNFFLRWYGPNNATLTIGGDVEPEKVIRLVEKYFGSIHRGPDVKNIALPTPTLEQSRYVTLVDNYAKVPMLSITFPTVPNYHPDMAPLACLAQVLGQGKASAFYKHIVKPQKAVSASAFSHLYELSGEFNIQATPMSGVTLSELYKTIQASLDSFELRGVTTDDIEKFKGAYESQLINSLQSVSGKVFQLAGFQTFKGNPNMIGELLRMHRAVTKEDVIRVYNQYIRNKPAVVVSVATKGDENNVVAIPNYVIDSVSKFNPDYGYEGLTYKKGSDNFDRKVIPPSGPNPSLKVPAFWTSTLKTGTAVIGSQSDELPMVSVIIKLNGGHILQASDTSKAGLSRLFAAMMNEDTQRRSAEEMQIELQKLGATIAVTSAFDGIRINVLALKKNIAPTLELLEERIFLPRFTSEAFSRLQQQTLESFKIRQAQPDYIADRVFAKVNYGPHHIAGIDQMGTEHSVKNLTLEDISAFHKQVLTGVRSQLVVVGNLTRKETLGYFKFLEKLPEIKVTQPKLTEPKPVEKTRVHIVHVPDAAQTIFRIGYLTGLKYDATGEFYKAGLMNFVLGGSFSSRLNFNLREEKGWTYSARSAFSGDKYNGQFLFGAAVKKEATDSAYVEVLKEISKYTTTDVDAEELSFMKSAISQREALLYETLVQKAGFIHRILEYNLPGGFVDEQARILRSINAGEIRQLASKWLRMDKTNVVLVGDKNVIIPKLKRLNLEVLEMDKSGKLIGIVP